MDPYVPLWCKSNFSFLEGASHPEELVDRAHALGLPAVAISDRDGVYGIVRAYERARELGMKLLYGSEVTIANGSDDGSHIVLLAKNREGYANLCRLLTKGRLRCPKGESRVELAEVLEHSCGLIGLWNGTISSDPARAVGSLREAFGGDLFALAARHRRDTEVEREAELRKTAARYEIPVVAGVEVLYHTPARRPMQDVLTCIRHGVTLHTAGTKTKPNAEHVMHAPLAMTRLFEDDPAAVVRTLTVAERCEFSLAELRYRYPSERLPDGTTSIQWLRSLSYKGARARYGGEVPDDVRAQLQKELSLIDELDYPGYFLTMYEIVEFCRREHILCQGRGSAANSVVCFCLGITAVDPVRMHLLFERFLSRERHEPPDIDLDISHERREEVIQHVYSKYGRSHAAMVANVIRYRTKSAIRDVGKVLGLPATALDRLAKLAFRYDGDWSAMLDHAGFDTDAPMHNWLVTLVDEIQNFPRHLSIHPGGFLLGHEPVDSIVPIENATMEARTVIQWDKDDIEALGLFKVDCLGLGSLTLVDKSFDLLREHYDVDLDMATIPAGDEATYEMVGKGDTVGVFQIESRAQMAMLPRLRPRRFYDLVIEISIVRPGPIAGNMVHPYLRRRNGEEEVTYPHESLVPVLEKTLGVPLFQEQVMKLAMVAADYTPGEADQLRRDMAAWRRGGRIERHRDRLISRMRAKGIAEEFAERVFEQIRGFGEYGFPESHAASFALIAYATAWLRCHYLDVFACGLLNSQPMGFYSPATIVDDAKRHGLVVRPIDVRVSEWDCTLELLSEKERVGAKRPYALRMGLRYVKGLGETVGRRIEAQAQARPFASLEDFARRVRPDEKRFEALAEGGAFDGFGISRRAALWDAWKLAREPRGGLVMPDARESPEFEDLDPLQAVAWDYQSTGHSARGHPLAHVRSALTAQGFQNAAKLATVPDGTWTRAAGIVICRQRPGTAKGVLFLTLEDETGFINLVVWPDVLDKFNVAIKSERFLGVYGKIQNQDSVTHLIAQRFWVPKLESQPSSTGSRDFC